MRFSFFHLLAISLLLLVIGCSPSNDFEIVEFQPVSSSDQSIVEYQLNMGEGILQGLAIPSDSEDAFQTIFTVTNSKPEEMKLAYKIYYRNESYKQPESRENEEGNVAYNPKASNNFYGSWETDDEGFRLITLSANDTVTIETDIRIQGNPRDEKRFFGAPMQNALMDQKAIDRIYAQIVSNEEWLGQVQHKANENKVSLEEQLQADIKWTIQMERKEGNENNRWQRNPRMGEYSFMLVVLPANQLPQVPYYVQDITAHDTLRGHFVDPYYYWNHHASELQAEVLVSSQKLLASMTYKAQEGLYVDPLWVDKLELDTTYLRTDVGYSDELFRSAPFEQFFSADKSKFQPQNVNRIADVGAANYTMEEYKTNLQLLEEGNTAPRQIGYTDYPGKTAGYDAEKDALYFQNTGNDGTGPLVKDNVGIRSRVGLTYGKYTAQLQFPAMLSNEGVWNGITNAFWLIYQDDAPWNVRGTCEEGYIVPNSFESEVTRAPVHNYSEIDIEIVKTSKYWPKTSYGDSTKYKVDDALDNNVIITCTNWDLACPDPSEFHTGVRDIEYNGQTFTTHRWDHFYKAITSKFEHPHDLAVGSPIYYQIEWLPNEIIWRIGTDPNEMIEVSYMDTSITSVPDNQMVLAITQEFHDGDWWPTAPFKQNAVPFPGAPLSGYLFDLTVE